MKKRALLSVSDKQGLIELAQVLIKHDIELISTGGTKTALEKAGLAVLGIEEVTEFPEMLDGRVKTLHPKIHGGLLFRRDLPEHQAQVDEHAIHAIDYVIVNLYPFQQTISKVDFTHEEAIENIDIGGPSMLRSAAKNHQFVTVICDTEDYLTLIEQLETKGETDLDFRAWCAAKVFRLTASYDSMIAEYLTHKQGIAYPERFTETFILKQKLRYGENPHQSAAFYQTPFEESYSMASGIQVQGKELSYNNIQDGAAALNLIKEFDAPTCVVLKHMNPCGVGTADTLLEAWQKAYEADPISIFGGIVAFNRTVDAQIARQCVDIFLEIILAPKFTEEALAIFATKKNLRVLHFPRYIEKPYQRATVRISGGLLVQAMDDHSTDVHDYNCVTQKELNQAWISDLEMGEWVVKHVKSNAIVIIKGGQTLGIGAGQMNRIGAAEIALKQAGEKAKGAILASDAFFPMDDTVRLAAEYGIACILQPGGSIKDKDSIAACDELGICMVFTGERHFKH